MTRTYSRRAWQFLTFISAMLLASAPAQSGIITSSSNNPLALSWSLDPGSNPPGLLTGNGSMSVSGFGSNLLSLVITLNNTSGLASNRLVAFGFGIDPNVIDPEEPKQGNPPDDDGVSFSDVADGGMVNAGLVKNGGENFPNVAGIEVCAFSNSTCAGGGNGGIPGGGSDTFTILLNGNWGSEVDFGLFALKYQTGQGSFEFYINQGCALTQIGACGVTTTSVPETPSAWLMLVALLSAIGMASLIRRTSH